MSVPVSTDNKGRAGEVAFWREALAEYFGFQVGVPHSPNLDQDKRDVLKRYGFQVMFLPAVEEDRFPAGAGRLLWNCRLDNEKIERIPLRSRWVAVESIHKTNVGHNYPNDALMSDIGVVTRFSHPYSESPADDGVFTVGQLLPKIAQKIGFSNKQVMIPSYEEWIMAANLFNWLRENRGMSNLPDLGATDASEWCRNAYGTLEKILMGGHPQIGFPGAIHRGLHWSRLESVAFRVLVVL